MRKKIFLLLVAISSFLNAQTSNEDIIIKINGDSIKVNIISVDEKISFNYPNEKVISILSKNCINKIIFGSGRVETFSEKILITIIRLIVVIFGGIIGISFFLGKTSSYQQNVLQIQYRDSHWESCPWP